MTESESVTLPETRSYDGDPDNWTPDDPKRGPGVPVCVRRGGATKPHERKELRGNGVSLIAHSTDYECQTCGTVRRFATSAWQTGYWCKQCGDVCTFHVKEVDIDD